MSARYSRCDSQFNIDRHLILFLSECPFYAEISRHVLKVPTFGLSTAGVTYDRTNDQLVMYYNPRFMESLSNLEVHSVIKHEFMHIVFDHIGARKREPHVPWNWATDLGINSIITEEAPKQGSERADWRDQRVLPAFALIPGRRPTSPAPGAKSSDEWRAPREKLLSLLESLPKMQSSEWYFAELMKFLKDNDLLKALALPGVGGSGSGTGGDEDDADPGDGTLDDHGGWDDVAEDQREYVEGKIRAIVAKAVAKADSTSTGWGSIPAEVREEIRRSTQSFVNWKAVLRQFIGTMAAGGRTTSIKRINRRYPYIQPGMRRGYVPKLLIPVDESGSVSDELLTSFFGELSALTKKVDIDMLPFDCTCSESDIVPWRRGTIPVGATKRTKQGGTDFTAPTRIFNDPKNRGRWNGMLILTDGQAPAPEPCRGKRGWVLGKDCKLAFETNELSIIVTNEKRFTGAWR